MVERVRCGPPADQLIETVHEWVGPAQVFRGFFGDDSGAVFVQIGGGGGNS